MVKFDEKVPKRARVFWFIGRTYLKESCYIEVGSSRVFKKRIRLKVTWVMAEVMNGVMNKWTSC